MASCKNIALALLSATCLVQAADANQTTTYSYDSFGRLIGTAATGTVNNGLQTTTSFDPAGNRINYAVVASNVSFAISPPAAVTEGGTLAFTVAKTGSTTSTLTVHYATANGTAAAGSDYNAASGTLTFAPADTVKTINVTTLTDSLVESPETMLVNLSSPSGGATITTAQASGTINNGTVPPPAVSFAIGAAAAVTEGGTLVYTVTKTGSTSSTLSVNYATANGSATAGSDYTATSGTLSFAPGETSKTISVPTTDDGTQESSETVLVNLSSPTGGATISTSQGSGTINDNDSLITITDASFQLQPGMSATYNCFYTVVTHPAIITTHSCTLNSTGVAVFLNVNGTTSIMKAGYSMTTNWSLQVQPAYFGTAQ